MSLRDDVSRLMGRWPSLGFPVEPPRGWEDQERLEPLTWRRYAERAAETRRYPPDAYGIYNALNIQDELRELRWAGAEWWLEAGDVAWSAAMWCLERNAWPEHDPFELRFFGHRPPALELIDRMAGSAAILAGAEAKRLRDGGALKPCAAEAVGALVYTLASYCSARGLSLHEVCKRNLDKLAARAANGTIRGEGDAR